jgi:hypothetical protein
LDRTFHKIFERLELLLQVCQEKSRRTASAKSVASPDSWIRARYGTPERH